MKNILLIGPLLFTAILFSQTQGAIKGTVTDQAMNSEPLLFANVQLKGSKTSYQTNFHGNFEISDVDAGEYTLVISYAGYDTEEFPIVVKENKIATIETDLSPIQISFHDLVGIDTASKKETMIPSDKEESPKE